jgi:hypothetical protein
MRPPPEPAGTLSGQALPKPRRPIPWTTIVAIGVIAPFTIYGFIAAATLMVRPSPQPRASLASKSPALDCASPRFSWRAECQRAATSGPRLPEARKSDDEPSTTGSIAQGAGGRSSTPPQNWRDAPGAIEEVSHPPERPVSGSRHNMPANAAKAREVGADADDVEVNYSAATRQKPAQKPHNLAKPTPGAEIRIERAARPAVPKAQGSTAPAADVSQPAAQPVRQQAEGEEAAVAHGSAGPARVAGGAGEAAEAGRTPSGERKGGVDAAKATRRSTHDQRPGRQASEEPKSDVRQLFAPARPASSADVPQQNDEANPAVTLQRPESNQ